jgi:LysR family glycine cleavage system transcriptional activator
MMTPLRSLSGLIDFASAGRLGSFRLAAQDLHKTPAAVSQQIRQLEESLGFRLFHRRPQQVVLTEKGSELFHTVAGLLAELRGKVAELQAEDDEQVLRISTTHSFAIKWLMRHLHDFNRRHPDLDVRVEPDDQLVAVEAGACDIALRIGPEEVLPGPEVFYREMLVVVVSPSLLQGDAERPDLAALIGHPLLHCCEIQLWRDLIASQGLSPSRLKFGGNYSHGGMLVQAAVSGIGVALAPYPLAHDDLARGNLIAAACPAIRSGVDYRLLFGANRGEINKIRLFRDWIGQEMVALEQDFHRHYPDQRVITPTPRPR